MGDRSTIEWTDATWNPLRGCTRVTQGCVNCYAEVMAARFSKPGQWGHGLAEVVKRPDGKADHRWTGKVVLAENQIDLPLRWKSPRKIFVNSTSDLFHESVPDEWIDRIFAVMAMAPHHTFQVLTKRPERTRAYMDALTLRRIVKHAMPYLFGKENEVIFWSLPLKNVWLGTSVEDQATADARIPHLLATPAATRFISAEPLLGPLDIKWALSRNPFEIAAGFLTRGHFAPGAEKLRPIDLVIAGGESGPGARPMHPDWPRVLRDQCWNAGALFFFKQWGEWLPVLDRDNDDPDWRADYTNQFSDRGNTRWINLAGGCGFHGERLHVMRRVGKKAAGRLLDGQIWNQLPCSRCRRTGYLDWSHLAIDPCPDCNPDAPTCPMAKSAGAPA